MDQALGPGWGRHPQESHRSWTPGQRCSLTSASRTWLIDFITVGQMMGSGSEMTWFEVDIWG